MPMQRACGCLRGESCAECNGRAQRTPVNPIAGYWTEMLSILGGDEADLGPQIARERMKELGEARAKLTELQRANASLSERLRQASGGIVTEYKQWNGSWFCHPGCTYRHDGYHVEACHFLAARKSAPSANAVAAPSATGATDERAEGIS